jgi:hypothetical protein
LLRRIFGLTRDGMLGGWRKLPSEELHNLYSFKQEEMGRSCSMHGGEELCVEGLGGKARRKETIRKI